MATDTKNSGATSLESSATDGKVAKPEDASKSAAEPETRPLAPETRRTLMFAAGAVVCLAITGIIEWSSRPAAIKEFGKVGQEFYSDFTDPTKATSLEVYVFDADKVQPLDFRVQRLDNGRWVIPSHHDYPADAADQLAKTASSIIGISRGAMITRWQADHAKYGVVNPKQDTLSVGDVEGVGKRIILRGDNDTVLADYIVGDKIEGESDQFYVRRPEEDEVYIAKLDIDLSTKFSDWIETDLLEVDSWNITELTVNDYSFDETQGPIRLAKSEVSRFHRKTSSDDWQLDGLNDETKEVDKDAIRDTVNTVGDLKIAGVRPKQQGLTPDLKLDRAMLKSQRDVDRLQSDLLTRGFLLQPGENGNQESLRLIAREGEMYAATNEGLIYRLHFGRAFAGSQEELETGFPPKTDDEQAAGDEENVGPESTEPVLKNDESKAELEQNTIADDGSDEDEKKTDSNKPGRYIFVRVEFDRKYLGEEPLKPTEPEQPAELNEPAVPQEQARDDEDSKLIQDAASGNEDASNKTATDDSAAAGEDVSAKENNPGDPTSQAEGTDGRDNANENGQQDDPLAEIRKKYEEDKRKYDDDLAEYERKKNDFDKKIADGEKKAQEQNRRFADWYYVIPGDSYDKLKLSRNDLVKSKETKDEDKDDEDSEKGQGTTNDTNSAAANQAAADEFLAENKSKNGVVTTNSGLQYEVINEGEGESPKTNSRVKVKYKGTLLDGTVFDESGDMEIEFGVDQVINGWTEALQMMKPGAKWRLYIPPDLAYGERGSGDKIGSNAALIFDVELVSFE